MAAKAKGKESAPAKGGIKIVHDLPTCIGCGACAAISRNWVMKGEKAKPLKTLLDKMGKEMEAAESCPVNCIHIVDLKTKKKLI